LSAVPVEYFSAESLSAEPLSAHPGENGKPGVLSKGADASGNEPKSLDPGFRGDEQRRGASLRMVVLVLTVSVLRLRSRLSRVLMG